MVRMRCGSHQGMLIFCFCILSVIMTASSSLAEQESYQAESSVALTFYGYLKFDAAWDSSRTNVGNFARWVTSEGSSENDAQFNMTANQSRFGLKLSGPNSENMKTSGKFEIDFYGGGAENKALPMMRHAYLELSWPESNFSILGGQTGDVISPLVADTVNYSVAWWAGDIGYRRAMIRVNKGFVSTGSSYLIQLAACRNMGDETEFSPGDTGEDAGYPSFQGRLAATIGKGEGSHPTIGLSGHWGAEEYDLDATGEHKNLESWSANLDVSLPLGNGFLLKGEVFTGENLDAYLGGIGQGINSNIEEIASTGGWAMLTITTVPKWRFSFGAAIDDPDDEDLDPGARSLNSVAWLSTWYSMNSHVTAGLELSSWKTDYLDTDSGENIRIQGALQYSF